MAVRDVADMSEHGQLREMVVAAADRRQDQEVSEMAMSAAQTYEARGRREGRIEGRHEMLLHLMRLKFGALPDAVVAKIEAIQAVAELSSQAEFARRNSLVKTMNQLCAST